MFIRVTDNIELDRQLKIVRVESKEIRLTGLEFGLVDYLAVHANRICSRQEILDEVWGSRFQYDPGTIDVHLNAIRKKLGFSKTRPIETVRGVGIVFRTENKLARYTIDLQSFAYEWLESHDVELKSHGLVPNMHLTPFVNEMTIAPEALRKMLDAILSALLPNSQPGRLRLSSKLTMQYFVLSLDVNGTVNELRIPIS